MLRCLMYKEMEVGMDTGVVRAHAEKYLWGYLFHAVPSPGSGVLGSGLGFVGAT